MTENTMIPSKMTAAERNDLRSLIRQRARLMKTEVKQRRLELMSDFERQLSATFSFDQDEVWKGAHTIAEQAVKDAQVVIEERCRELKIPKEFAPTISMMWFGRGQNALKERRSELRIAAKARLDALEASAKTEIDRISVDGQTNLIADGLTSEAAQAFLEQMPSTESLMPVLELNQVRGLLEQGES